MDIVLVAAVGKNSNGDLVIGNERSIPWARIEADRLRLHRDFISNKPVILGYNTFKGIEEIIYRSWPRSHLVVVGDSQRSHSLKNGLKDLCQKSEIEVDFVRGSREALELIGSGGKRLSGIDYSSVSVLGGARTYQDFMIWADRLELTEVERVDKKEFEGDCYFPKILDGRKANWNEPSIRPWQNDGELRYRFVSYTCCNKF
jgi:dihydrofolate reductase